MMRLMQTECILCKQPATDDYPLLCPDCVSLAETAPPACQQCGNKLQSHHQSLCGQCQQKPPPVDLTLCLNEYTDELRELVQTLKFGRQFIVADTLGKLLAGHIINSGAPLPDLIIPVPAHKKRLRERGFNQAVEIAKPVARRLGLSIDNELITRLHYTAPQTQVSDAKQRRKNPRGSFACQNTDIQHAAIVDDIITTGATVNEIARLLKRLGVRQVSVWAIAHA